MSQPIVIYNHGKYSTERARVGSVPNELTPYLATGPNPKKVVIILEELGIPYTLTDVTKPKEEAFLKINPNGRMPAIQDPNNNNFVLWESGAICKYIVETYDKENKLNITTLPEKWYLEQWLQFQMSGQGPYYGQGVWFHKFHAEDVPSAKKRYLEQIERVWGVLDNVLKDKKYLVGDKL